MDTLEQFVRKYYPGIVIEHEARILPWGTFQPGTVLSLTKDKSVWIVESTGPSTMTLASKTDSTLRLVIQRHSSTDPAWWTLVELIRLAPG